MTAADAEHRRVCARCHRDLPPNGSRGRPRIWCSQACRRAAYEERRAARNGAIAVRVEIREKLVERRVRVVEYQDRVTAEARAKQPSAAAVATVLASPRSCRTVLEELANRARSGTLNGGEHAPTVRAAMTLLHALRDANLLR